MSIQIMLDTDNFTIQTEMIPCRSVLGCWLGVTGVKPELTFEPRSVLVRDLKILSVVREESDGRVLHERLYCSWMRRLESR